MECGIALPGADQVAIATLVVNGSQSRTSRMSGTFLESTTPAYSAPAPGSRKSVFVGDSDGRATRRVVTHDALANVRVSKPIHRWHEASGVFRAEKFTSATLKLIARSGDQRRTADEPRVGGHWRALDHSCQS